MKKNSKKSKSSRSNANRGQAARKASQAQQSIASLLEVSKDVVANEIGAEAQTSGNEKATEGNGAQASKESVTVDEIVGGAAEAESEPESEKESDKGDTQAKTSEEDGESSTVKDEESQAEAEEAAPAADEAKEEEKAEEPEASEEPEAQAEDEPAQAKVADEPKAAEAKDVESEEKPQASTREASKHFFHSNGDREKIRESVVATMGDYHEMEGDGILTYEYPLLERVRHLLRIEYLFSRFKSLCQSTDPYVHHFAIMSVFEIMDCASRAEFKLDLLQELERQRQRRMTQEVDDDEKYAKNQEEVKLIGDLLTALQNIHNKFAQNLRENEWLMALKQKMQVSGGVSPFDIPSFYLWQNLDFDRRLGDLQKWYETLKPTGDAIHYLLTYLRKNKVVFDCKTKNGMYQQNGLGTQMTMLQIVIPTELKVLPEISANRHVMNIHFVEPDFNNPRGKSIKEDIEFKLALCSFEYIPRTEEEASLLAKPGMAGMTGMRRY